MYQEITLIGRIGSTEIRNKGTEKEHVEFSLAVNGTERAPSGDVVSVTNWFHVKLTGRLYNPQNCSALTKGAAVMVQGKLVTKMAASGYRMYLITNKFVCLGSDVSEGVQDLTIIGRVGATEVRGVNDKKEHLEVSIALNSTDRAADGSTVQTTSWYRVKLTGRLYTENLVGAMTKGRTVLAKGRLMVKTHNTTKEPLLFIFANQIALLSSKSNS